MKVLLEPSWVAVGGLDVKGTVHWLFLNMHGGINVRGLMFTYKMTFDLCK